MRNLQGTKLMVMKLFCSQSVSARPAVSGAGTGFFPKFLIK